MFDRRVFLKSTGLALFAGGFLPNVFVRMAEAGTPASRRVLVAIFQRGAVDGLNVVVPYGEKTYYDARPSIAVPPPGSGENAVLDLDGFFGLHPSLAPVLPWFKDRSAAFVHAAGSPDATRSHFDAQDFMESGTPGVKATADGFLGRALDAGGKKADKTSPLRAVSLTPGLPRILAGRAGAVAMSNLADFGIRDGGATPAVSDTAPATSTFGQQVTLSVTVASPNGGVPTRSCKSWRPSGHQSTRLCLLLHSRSLLQLNMQGGRWSMTTPSSS